MPAGLGFEVGRGRYAGWAGVWGGAGAVCQLGWGLRWGGGGMPAGLGFEVGRGVTVCRLGWGLNLGGGGGGWVLEGRRILFAFAVPSEWMNALLHYLESVWRYGIYCREIRPFVCLWFSMSDTRTGRRGTENVICKRSVQPWGRVQEMKSAFARGGGGGLAGGRSCIFTSESTFILLLESFFSRLEIFFPNFCIQARLVCKPLKH